MAGTLVSTGVTGQNVPSETAHGGGSGSPPTSTTSGRPSTHHTTIHSAQSNNNDRSEIPNSPSVPTLEPSPEKPVTSARTPTDRKRKRKNANNQNQIASQTNLGVALAGTSGVNRGTVPGTEVDASGNHPALINSGNGGVSTTSDITLNNKGAKKINDYFKHTPSSPSRAGLNPSGAKSPLPFPPAPGLYPPSPKAQYVGSPSPVGGIQGAGVGPGNGGSGSESGSTTPPDYATLMQPPKLPAVSKSMQTDMCAKDIENLEAHSVTELEAKDSRIDELQRVNEELTRQLTKAQKEVEDQKATILKCLNVAKELLIEKSTIERKDARAKCMQNRLRLGQFVTKRAGAIFQENWTDGYAFQELAKRQEEIANERDEIDRKKKMLAKRKPNDSNGPGRKRASKAQGDQSSDSGNGSEPSSSTVGAGSTGGSNVPAVNNNASTTGANLSSTPMSGPSGTVNGSTDETLFTKPPPRDGMTMQEYYEAEEILRLRHNTLKKEDAEMQLEMEKLERARNLHIRELKRIHNEDQSR